MENLSLGISKKVGGIEIKKMPIGAYLKALEKIKALPQDFIGACFPGKDAKNVLESLTTLDEKGLLEMATALLMTAPQYAISFVAELIDVPEERLLTDENIGLDGLLDICVAFVEINRLGKFLQQARGMGEKLKGLHMQTLGTGSKD